MRTVTAPAVGPYRPMYFAAVKVLRLVIRSMRPEQWTKNLFVFAALLFSRNLLDAGMLGRSGLAFVLFCLVSGAVYLLNDILDRSRDAAHPVKRDRPVASGRLGIASAAVCSAVVAAGALAASWSLGWAFTAAALSYLVVQMLYSTLLKHVVILDVFALASGFVIRVVAGAVALSVEISSWLLVCTTLIALFLALCKRRHELTTLGESAAEHRKVLAEYSSYLLDQMIAVVAASTVIAYALYTMAEPTVEKFGTPNLLFTLPFVIYGLFRYLFLVHRRDHGGRPEHTLLTDPPLLITIVLWALTAGIVVYA